MPLEILPGGKKNFLEFLLGRSLDMAEEIQMRLTSESFLDRPKQSYVSGQRPVWCGGGLSNESLLGPIHKWI